MAILDSQEIMFKAFEPKVQNRFLMYMDADGISIPSLQIPLSNLIILTLTERLEGKENGKI